MCVYINKNFGLYIYIEVIVMMKFMDFKGVVSSSYKIEYCWFSIGLRIFDLYIFIKIFKIIIISINLICF